MIQTNMVQSARTRTEKHLGVDSHEGVFGSFQNLSGRGGECALKKRGECCACVSLDHLLTVLIDPDEYDLIGTNAH